MGDLVTSLGFGVAELAVDTIKAAIRSAAREAGYCLSFNRTLRKLQTRKEQLVLNIESVRNSVKKAKDRTEEIDVVAKKWLKDADALIIEVDNQ